MLLPVGRGSSVVRRNHVVVGGASVGRPTVFGHGFGCDQTMWDFVTPAFEDRGPIITFDYVGAGRSDLSAYDPARYATLHGYAEDLVEVLDAVGATGVDFIGHSASGMIGVLAALMRPDLFRALVCVGASPRYLDDDGYRGGFTRPDVDGLLEAMRSNFLAWSQALAPVVMGNPARPELTDQLAGSFARTDGRIAEQFARAIFLSDYRDVLPRLRVATLVVQSDQDPMVPAEVADFLHRTIPGSTLVHLKASGHYPQVSGPEETSEVILGYLGQLP